MHLERALEGISVKMMQNGAIFWGRIFLKQGTQHW